MWAHLHSTNVNPEKEAAIVYDEVHAVVKRYLSEGDELSAFGVVGALDAVKLDVLDMLLSHNIRTKLGEKSGT